MFLPLMHLLLPWLQNTTQKANKDGNTPLYLVIHSLPQNHPSNQSLGNLTQLIHIRRLGKNHRSLRNQQDLSHLHQERERILSVARVESTRKEVTPLSKFMLPLAEHHKYLLVELFVRWETGFFLNFRPNIDNYILVHNSLVCLSPFLDTGPGFYNWISQKHSSLFFIVKLGLLPSSNGCRARVISVLKKIHLGV